MDQLSLFKIISRLHAMQSDQTDDVQVRRFEMFGVELCNVEYKHVTGLYTVEEYRPYQQFEFDKLDLAAIEIYDCLSELQETF